jgi:predicted RNase H-like HicB family nuclease
MTQKSYTAVYEHDGSMWFVRIAEIEGCHSQGRTIAQARERIREALALFDARATSARIVDDVRLPKEVRTRLRRLAAEKARMDALSRSVRAHQAHLAHALTKDVGVSLYDAGALLGISKQRVQQILDEG